mmetsp:Transcript_14402/g.21884  ORF Transcript_14402/g.21884 Transcript_14402/m.21884 type:complete len:395 (+) Transcript_14402:27-1211(+)
MAPQERGAGRRASAYASFVFFFCVLATVWTCGMAREGRVGGRMAVRGSRMAAPKIPMGYSMRGVKARAEISANAPEDQDKSLLPEAEFGDPKIREQFERVLMNAQDKISKALEDVDGGAKFVQDRFIKTTGGGGRSRVLSDGNVFEKAGINLSVLKGELPYDFVAKRGECKGFSPGEKIPYVGMGLSSVIHPKNPFSPTMHFNYRLFQTKCGVWWFGGGTDITPSYIDKDDMELFHGTYKDVCDKHDPGFYAKFKKWADEYFVIAHRGETRGLGGIFSDDMNDRSAEELLAFYTDCVNSVIPSYVPIVDKHKSDEFTEEQKDWQGVRRGRYVEFNLVYDRGTIFGLKQNLNAERILMSLPEKARWEYNHQIKEGSPEADIMDAFKNPRDWVALS